MFIRNGKPDDDSRGAHWKWLPALLVVCAAAVPVSGKDVIEVERVWSGHPVGFSLLTQPPYQFVAYYDAQRQMTVARRKLGEHEWTYRKLPSRVGWDSHNYVTMALDRENHLHVAGNMHCDPLVYFRTTRPWEVGSLERVPRMIGPKLEQSVTYPVFLRTQDERLVFRYRDGGSGRGDDIYNVYSERERSWHRLIDKPLVSGEGKRNAYCSRPKRGPDGLYHMVWVWRDSPDCATNHDLSYACSGDLVHWTNAAGDPLTLPITLDSGAVVDPVPVRGGLINGGHRLGFDSQNRPVIAYHKYDARGDTQVYVARFEDGQWNIRQVSDWRGYRWEFSGGGSIPFEVRLGGVTGLPGGRLKMNYRYGRGRGVWILSAETLEVLKTEERSAKEPPRSRVKVDERASAAGRDGSERENRSGAKGATDKWQLQPKRASDLGSSGSEEYRFMLQWATLEVNRDRPHPDPPPPPVMLRVLKLPK